MIVGICGAAGSGKDTAGAALIKELGYAKSSFANKLKKMLCLLFGWTMDQWEDAEWKEAPQAEAFGLSPRELAQTLGTEWGRKMVHEDIWVRAALRSTAERTVFTDVRFPNEAHAIRDAGGVLIYATCINSHTLTEHTAHLSERWQPWLLLFADALISAERGEIEQLQHAAASTVLDFMRGDAKRFVPCQSIQQQLDRIEAEVLNENR